MNYPAALDVAAVARHSPHQIAPALNDITPSIIKDSQRDDEELRESCLQVKLLLLLDETFTDHVNKRLWKLLS